MNYMDKYREWLNNDFLIKSDREILENMTDEEIEESFSTELEFGTAGIRGIMGLGTSKINIYNIGKVTQGLSSYLNKHYKDPSVVIGYDTRDNSREFAFKAALVLNQNNIKTYIFKDITSTPMVSFAVKYLKCKSGIVITSSHNASIYNGYKVYNESGSQILNKEADLILSEINKINDLSLVKESPLNNLYFNYVDDTLEEAFIRENEKVIINQDLIDNYASKLKFTYTSFHGTGIRVIPFLLEKYKIRYNLVNEQCKIDKDFTYAKEPNPEYEYNYDLAKEYAKYLDSDIILASDPDADRIGVLYKSNNTYKMLNGNMIGIIFLRYLLDNTKVYKNNYVVRSIVTSNMFDKVADLYNAKVKEVLTGCKNIAKVKEEDKENYLFGFEESLGYVFNININDKDAFSSTIFLIEILSYLKSIDLTLEEYIEDTYNKFGYYKTETISIVYDGVNAKDKMSSVMKKLREENIFDEEEVIDYLNKKDDLKTDCLKFIMNDNEYFMVRPSGTEPKLKIYFIVNDVNEEKTENRLNKLINKVNKVLN